jgi:hypothetical protein
VIRRREKRASWPASSFWGGDPPLEEVALIRIALRHAVALMGMILDAGPGEAHCAEKLRFTAILGAFLSN